MTLTEGDELQYVRSVDPEITRLDVQRSRKVQLHGLQCTAISKDELESYWKVLRAWKELNRRAQEGEE